MLDPRKSTPFPGESLGGLVIPAHPKAPNLGHLRPITIMVQAGRHLVITGAPGSGKDITLNALLDLPEAKDYVTPAVLRFHGAPGLPILKGCENDIADVGHPRAGYRAFRREASNRFPNRPTACIVMDQDFGAWRTSGSEEPAALSPNTVVVHLVSTQPQGLAAPFVGIRRMAEVLADLREGRTLREAVMGVTPLKPL